MQVDPVKPALKAPGIKRLKLEFDEPLSNFAFKFNLRCFSWGVTTATAGLRAGLKGPWGERQGLTLVHYSAQRKHIMWDTLGA